MDKFIEIQSGLEELWEDLKSGDIEEVAMMKLIDRVEKLIIEASMDYEHDSREFIEINRIIPIFNDIKSGALNLEVDYPYICEQIDKVLDGLRDILSD